MSILFFCGIFRLMDTLSREKRSWCMSKIRSKNTKPELIVRRILTEMRWRYRLHVASLPGKPDIAIAKRKIAIFVNGCFWHQHKGCKRQSLPKSNIEYWHKKLERNIKKQKEDIKILKKMGWSATKVWECQTKNEKRLANKLRRIFYEEKY